jgi:hypothetical protein
MDYNFSDKIFSLFFCIFLLILFLGMFIRFVLWLFNKEVLKWLFIAVGVAVLGFVAVVLGR